MDVSPKFGSDSVRSSAWGGFRAGLRSSFFGGDSYEVLTPATDCYSDFLVPFKDHSSVDRTVLGCRVRFLEQLNVRCSHMGSPVNFRIQTLVVSFFRK